MSPGVFSCEVVYVGRRQVTGAQSSATLTAIVDDLVRPHPQPPPTPPPPPHLHHHPYPKPGGRGERCQLVCDEEQLRVAAVRKDEGFESDTESSSSACDDPCCGTHDIKVINDHVLRLDQLLGSPVVGATAAAAFTPPDEASSSATSSGAESEDDSPRTAQPVPHPGHPPPAARPPHQVVEAGCGETLLMSDILYCHVAPSWPRVLVVVAKAAGAALVHAHVFQCPSQETARALYAHYKEASNKYKLNRYRNSKRKTDAGGTEAPAAASATGGARPAQGKPPSGASRDRHSCVAQGGQDAAKNIQVIQVGESGGAGGYGLMQVTDGNGVTHIEIETGPCSLVSSSSDTSDFSSIISLGNSLPPHLPAHPLPADAGDAHKHSSSCPSSLVGGGREVLIAGELDKKFRQRQPALLLRPDDRQRHDISGHDSLRRGDKRRDESRRDKRREEAGGRSRRDWHEDQRLVAGQESPRPPPGPRLTQERPSRPREQSRGRVRTSHNKGPAPPPPPRRHPNNPSLLLVPTKSGAEHTRAFYPKESHIVRGNKVVRVEVAGYRWPDVNNNPHYTYYSGAATWMGPHEYHSLRPRDSPITPEMRRRSRSKSPARRPLTHRYMDAVSTFSLSQKLRDISDAVFTGRRGGPGPAPPSPASTGATPPSRGPEARGHQRSLSTVSAPGGDTEGSLKPVIKKGPRPEASPQCRRVTFSAYATVQVMDA